MDTTRDVTEQVDSIALMSDALRVLRERPGLATPVYELILEMHEALALERGKAVRFNARLLDADAHVEQKEIALAVERDRADRAEARLGAGGSEWDSLAAGRDAAVNRIELVQAVLVRFEDGEIESLESAIREIDCVVNNTKDDELSEATA